MAFDTSLAAKWSAALTCAESIKARQTSTLNESLSQALNRSVNLPSGCYRSLECEAIFAVERIRAMGWSQEQFSEARGAALRTNQSFRYAIRILNDQLSREPVPRQDSQLSLRLARDQVLRGTLVQMQTAGVPAPESRAAIVADLMFRIDLIGSDIENATWLEEAILKQQWPTLSGSGPASGRAAWMLAQHSDRSPIVQYRALRAMEAAHARGETEGRWYSSLQDRFGLRIDGVQRFGTQMECVAGRWVAQALEAPEEVDARRAGVGLGPLRDQLAAAGACRSP